MVLKLFMLKKPQYVRSIINFKEEGIGVVQCKNGEMMMLFEIVGIDYSTKTEEEKGMFYLSRKQWLDGLANQEVNVKIFCLRLAKKEKQTLRFGKILKELTLWKIQLLFFFQARKIMTDCGDFLSVFLFFS